MELRWDSFEYVPVQDFSKPWTDAELYKEYELDEEEVCFIESSIGTIDDAAADTLKTEEHNRRQKL